MAAIRACLFDLDGVIVDTAKYHFKAWQDLAKSLGVNFTEHDNEQLKGVSRMESLEFILSLGSIEMSQEDKENLAKDKNDNYLEYVNKMDASEVLPGVEKFLSALQEAGIKIGLGSASKNAIKILEQVKLISYFETIVDGNKVAKSKPDPEVFELGAKELNVAPSETLVFEDAPKGVHAALHGQMYVVGIGDADVLGHAHLVYPGFDGIGLEILDQLP